jgi:hypothetical protein
MKGVVEAASSSLRTMSIRQDEMNVEEIEKPEDIDTCSFLGEDDAAFIYDAEDGEEDGNEYIEEHEGNCDEGEEEDEDEGSWDTESNGS